MRNLPHDFEDEVVNVGLLHEGHLVSAQIPGSGYDPAFDA
jgi:hypothetical protein